MAYPATSIDVIGRIKCVAYPACERKTINRIYIYDDMCHRIVIYYVLFLLPAPLMHAACSLICLLVFHEYRINSISKCMFK